MDSAPTGRATAGNPVRWRPTHIPSVTTRCRRREDGSLVLTADEPPLQRPELSLADYAERWAAERPAQPAFQERDGVGWRGPTWGEFWVQVQSVGAALVESGLAGQRLMVLSENTVELAVLLVAAEAVGVAPGSASPAYSLQSRGFERLRQLHALLKPARVFVQAIEPYAKALAALRIAGSATIAVSGPDVGHLEWRRLAQTPLTPDRLQAFESARAARRAEDIARVFFTSGSTGTPKGVPTRYANLRAFLSEVARMCAPAGPSVLLDWLPWNHAYGALGSMGRVTVTGGTLYIDDGRPTPASFARTLHNLRDVAPTVFATVPATWAMLVSALERDPALAARFFSRMNYMSYGSASLPQPLWQRIQDLAERTVGERIQFVAGFGSTESTAMGSNFNRPGGQAGNIGVPQPGVELKLVPLEGADGRWEIRTRGAHVFGGYLGQPDLTAAAFDEEGFYRFGDAVRLVDEGDPTQGMRFAGRIVEDFKLDNGSWVRTGATRLALLERCSPLLSDAVICGHDRPIVTALAWPNLAACRAAHPDLADLDPEALVRHPGLLSTLRDQMRAAAQGQPPSARVQRLLLMAEPPSIDSMEIADKGYVNQAAVRARRAALVERLYQDPLPADVASV